MRSTYFFTIIAVLALTLAGLPGTKPSQITATTGNGAPNGAHYNLNIIGVPQDKTAEMNNPTGGRIFVRLNGGDAAGALNNKLLSAITKINKIFLVPAPPGESFRVLDANATDATGALFQLPPDVSTNWTVWARALGTPGGISDTTTCATTAGADGVLGTTDDVVLCSMATLHIERTKNAKFTNVSSTLLFLTITVVANTTLSSCLGGATGTVNVPLFSGCLQNYFWNYDNNGLKLLQLRFYPIG
jgi:hypothetical protein